MKKVSFFSMLAAAALMMGVTSCNKEGGSNPGSDLKQVSIKIAGVIQSGTRAVEAPGETAAGTIQLTGGHIFVIDPLGAVTHNEALNVAQATNTGQTLGAQVPADSRVYIIGNIPAADQAAIAGLTNWSGIQAATSAMTTQGDYTEAALANSNGAPAAITVTGTTTATATVSIKPLISRLELVQVKGGANIKAFTVTGVYVDSYYPSFTYGGSYSGTIFSQGQGGTFSGIGDAGTWAATGTPLVASPDLGLGDNELWAHNVASGGLPRFIIALTGIKYDDGGTEVDLGNTTSYYLTVTGYTGVTAFERGKIYRIGGTNGITFDEDDLGLTPNPVDIDLTLTVSIEEWVLVTPNAEL